MDINTYDEKTAALIRTCLEQQRTRNPKAIASLESLKKIAEKTKDNSLLGFACFYLANTHYRMNLNYHHFRSYLVKGISCLQQTDDYSLLARSYNYVGIDASNNGCYDVAYHYFMMSQRIVEPMNDPYLESIISVNLGQLYARLGNDHLARQTIRLSIQQAEKSVDDLYYLHNLISCHCLDGMLSIRLKDYKSAHKTDDIIRELMETTDDESLMGSQLLVLILRTELALVDNDRPLFDERFAEIMRFLETSDAVFDFIEDVLQFCMFLIEQNELPSVRRILDSIDDDTMRSGSIQMMFNVTEVEIACYDTLKDEEHLNFFLRRQHDLEKRRQSEQNRIYFMSISLIDSMYDYLRSVSPVDSRVQEEEIPSTKEYRDELTGLPNKKALSLCLNRAFRTASVSRRTLGVAVLHVGHLQEYTETYGTKAGNILMQRLGLELRVVAYQYQIHCIRHEGAAFVMVFENMTREEVLKIVDALTAKTSALDGGETDGAHPAVTIGICNRIPETGESPADYLMEAHAALDEAGRALGEGTHSVVLVPEEAS